MKNGRNGFRKRFGRNAVSVSLAALLFLACGDDGITGVVIGSRIDFPDHSEIEIRFVSGEDTLAGTLYTPPGPGPFAVSAVNPGSSWTLRSSWETVNPFVTGLGVGFFSYDKRGQGASGGTCCPPGDGTETFNLLARDLASAVRALANVKEVDPTRVGVFGSSQGAWIAPLAANLVPDLASFVILGVGGAVSTGQENLYDTLTGFDVCVRTGTSLQEITQQLVEAGPSGFDPIPSLERMAQPAIWLLGGNDLSHPTQLTVINIDEIRSRITKNWAVHVFPDANHDLVAGGEICQVEGELVDVLTPMRNFFDTF